MFKKIARWLTGYVSINISGPDTYRFINLCKKNNVAFQKLCINGESYDCILLRKDYNSIQTYLKKTNVNIKITYKKGLPYFFYKYKRRKIFLLCLLMFFIVIYGFSFFIWDINVDGTSKYTEEDIIKHIKENYVSTGTLINKIDCTELEKTLRQDYEDIAWISCEIKGTQLNITLMETIKAEEIEAVDYPCNIVACKDGIITEIIVSNGTRVTSYGEPVKKNDILITGVVNVYNEYDELLETNYVSASGTVTAIVNYNYYDEFDMNYTEKIYTGQEKNKYQLVLFDNLMPSISPKIKYSLYDTLCQDKNLVLGKSFYLPIVIRQDTYKEYTLETHTLTEAEAEEKARIRLNEYIENLKKKGVSIIENNVKISYEKGKCIASGTIVAKEAIGVPARLEIIEQGEEP